jgi:hypothetical protein
MQMKKVSTITDVKTISPRTLSTCISWLCSRISTQLTKCWSVQQVSPLYIGRQYWMLWKLCVHSDYICHKHVSAYNNHRVWAICLFNNHESSMVKTQFILHGHIQQETASQTGLETYISTLSYMQPPYFEMTFLFHP